MSLGTVAAVVGIAGTAYGAYNSNRAVRGAENAQQAALEASRTQLNSSYTRGLNGTGAFSDVVGGGVNLTGGQLDPISAALSQYAGQAVPSYSNDLSRPIQAAIQNVNNRADIGDLGLNGLDRILGGVNNQFTQAQQGLANAGQLQGFDPSRMFGNAQMLANYLPQASQFQSGLQNQAFGNAQQQLSGLGQTYQDAYSNTLGTLRAQAQPEEARAMAGLTDNLYATGRLGSSGGALQTEAFARGLGQADLSRQLAATQQAQSAQQNALGLAQGQSQLGMGLAQQANNNMAGLSSAANGLFGMGAAGTSLQDSLLNSAFGRFNTSAQMSADLNQARFARSMYGNETAYARAQNELGTAVNMAQLPAQLQAQQLQNANTALSGQSGIQQQLLQLFQAGLSQEQAAANARIGAGSNMASIVGSPSFGAAGQANAAMWSQLGSALLNQNGLGGALGRIFGSGTGTSGTTGDLVNTSGNWTGPRE